MSWRTRAVALAARLGFVVTRRGAPIANVDPGFDAAAAGLEPFTMTSRERMHALYQATAYVAQAAIPGAIVECGVWRGGSMMLVCRTLLARGARDRGLFLFDTYAGMTAPTAEDVDVAGRPASALLAAAPPSGDPESVWCVASLDDVRANVLSTGYPADLCHFVVGRVEETLPARAPEQIALLRLDTDWYASTRHELAHLFPRLSDGGVLIVDDYGHWRGARKAVDEYLSAHAPGLLLHRIDATGRIATVRRGPA